MKIALVMDQLDRRAGGLQVWVIGFARYLAALNHEVRIIAFSKKEHDFDLPVDLLPDPGSHLRRAFVIEKYLAGLDLDVVHDSGIGWSGDVFHPHTGSNILAARRAIEVSNLGRRVRTAISPRACMILWRMARLEKIQLARAARIVAVSEFVREQLVTRCHVGAERITLIRNGVDTLLFSPERANAARPMERARLGLGESVVYLLIANNFLLKGVDTAIRATARLIQAGKNVRLVVVGEGLDPAWQRRALGSGVSDRVHFIGYCPDMPAVYGASDVVVHPTRWDACSLCTLEGMAVGRPVITTRWNGASEIMTEGQSGFVLANPEDDTLLADRMAFLMSEQKRSEMGSAARLAAQHCDLQQNYRAMANVLIEAAAARVNCVKRTPNRKSS